MQEREVGLVVAVAAGHQLHVRPVLIREIAIPGVAELVVPPGPELLAWRHTVVGNVNHAGTGRMVITTEEVVT